MSVLYTLCWLDTGIVIQSGDVPNMDCLPAVPEGAEIRLGVELNPETERFDGPNVVPFAPDREPEALVAAIERHRAKLLAGGFYHNFGDERGIHRIGTSEDDEKGWDKVTKIAQAYINAGQPNAQISIATNTGRVMVTAAEWQLILIEAALFQQPIYQKSFDIQEMNPIPQDVENPEYWT